MFPFVFVSLTLRKNCPYLELFWFLYSRIRTEYKVSLCIHSECGKIRTLLRSEKQLTETEKSNRFCRPTLWLPLIFIATCNFSLNIYNYSFVRIRCIYLTCKLEKLSRKSFITVSGFSNTVGTTLLKFPSVYPLLEEFINTFLKEHLRKDFSKVLDQMKI